MTRVGIIIVDHGSRSEQGNAVLHEVVARFAARPFARDFVVEPAHMELAEPSIAQAYATCARRGASLIVVCPFFLAPGKHMTSDIPRLAAEAASEHPSTTCRVADPLGADELIVDLLAKRVDESLCLPGHAQRRGAHRGSEEPATATDKGQS